MSEKLLAAFVFEVVTDGENLIVKRKTINAGLMMKAFPLQSREEELANRPLLEQAADLIGAYTYRVVQPDTHDLVPIAKAFSREPGAT